jgi:hypothetical protein
MKGIEHLDFHDDLQAAQRRGLLKQAWITKVPCYFQGRQYSACIYITYTHKTAQATRERLQEFFQIRGLAISTSTYPPELKVFIP